jgi:hypothetical protein
VDRSTRGNIPRQSEKEIILQTTKLDGIYSVEIRLLYYSNVIYKFEINSMNSNNENKYIREHIIN